MRSFEEVKADLSRAQAVGDVDVIRALADELSGMDSYDAKAAREQALGVVNNLTGEYHKALDHFRASLDVYTEAGDKQGIATATSNLGTGYLSISSTDALQFLERALHLFEELGDSVRVGVTWSNLGNAHSDLGEFDRALECYERSLRIAEESHDQMSAGVLLANIATVYRRTSFYPTALEYAHRALDIYTELEHAMGIARVVSIMGSISAQIGSLDESVDYFLQALEIYKQHSDREGTARILGNLGSVYDLMGHKKDALDNYRSSLALHQELGSPIGIARIMGHIADIQIADGALEEAERLLEEQGRLQVTEPSILANRHAALSGLALHRDDLDASLQELTTALEIATQTGLRSNVVAFHLQLRDLAQKRNDFDGYIKHNTEYQRLSEEVNGKEVTQKLAMMEAEKKMAAERLEAEQHKALLYGALPADIADRMIRGEDVSGDKHENAAVLFLDVVGFTTYSSMMDPHETTALLAQIFKQFDEICKEYEVTKVKTIGDAYLAVAFSNSDTLASQRTGQSASRLASAALEMIVAEYRWPNGNPVVFRIGLHVGDVVAGVIGTERLQYDVWGDTVNVASRMESTGEPGKIHVSSAFAESLKRTDPDPSPSERGEGESYSLIERGMVDVKGKGKMQTYWLERS